MQITSALLNSLRRGFNTRYTEGFAMAKPKWQDLASLVPSGSKSEVYAFLDRIPRFREWVGERVVQNLSERALELTNRDFELTVAVKRNEIEDDNLGMFSPLMQQMGFQAAMWPDDLVHAALIAGTTAEAFDGQYFFDSDHPKNLDDVAAGTQSNNFTSRALTGDNLQYVRAKMQELVGADGRTLGVTPTHLVVPPALEKTAREILIAQYNANGSSNVMQGIAQLIVWDRLAGADTTWYLLDLSKPIKPLIFQQRKAPNFTSLTDEADENVFKRGEYIYGADARGAGGYGPWFLAARAIA
jgi:phage major head subunit gpT-like protein